MSERVTPGQFAVFRCFFLLMTSLMSPILLLTWAIIILVTGDGFSNAVVLMENGSYRYCSATKPCPSGYTCAYGPLAPDTKLCFSGTITTGRPGRCPLDFEVVAGTGSNFLLQQQRCLFDSDCLYYSQKCCYNRAIGVPTCTVATSIPNDPVVTTLISGSADLVPNGISFPATISLVQSRGKNILFETGTPAQRSDIISALRNTSGLTLADIHYVINSHGHPDHLANNGMFPDTPILNNMLEITGSFVKTNGLGQARPARSFVLDDPRIEAIRTPGHTLTDISMIVSNVTNLGTVALVGDLIVSETDAASNQDWQSTSQNVEAQTANRRYVLCLADWIVPGHGRLFRVTPNMRTVNGGCVGAAQRIT